MPSELIPHEKVVLANGLEVLLHEDHSNPVVSVYVHYHVGSSREAPGKSGFAHLFEHMLFQGSANVEDNGHFRRIQEAGGTLNGATNADSTHYYETLPADRLELALWLESDRMGFLLPAMTQAKLDNQLDVVRNERRQSYENRPYGLVHETLLANLYPPDHPYSWPTIGSMEDLAEATLEDVGAFFERWYGPNNATLSIGGDFDREEALALVERYFGGLPRGPVVDRPGPRPSPLAEAARPVIEDNVQLPQLTLAWPTVHGWHPEEAALTLLLDMLSANRASVLDRALQIDEEVASHVTAQHYAAERAGMLVLNLRPRPGVTLGELEARVDALLAAFVADGVTPEQEARLARMKARREGALVRALETVAQRTGTIGLFNCLYGDPGRIDATLERVRRVTLPEVLAAARTHLVGRPRVALSIVPRGRRDLAAAARGEPVLAHEPRAEPDRRQAPPPGPAHPFESPALWHAALPNGVPLVGTVGGAVPLARFAIAVGAGRLAETPEACGLATLTARMLEEGTRERTGLDWTDALDALGADISVSVGEDELRVDGSVLERNLDAAVELVRELFTEPRFDAEAFARVQRQLLVDVDTRHDRVDVLAADAFRKAVFGAGIKGAPPLGTPETVAALSLDDVRAFWGAEGTVRPARLALVGNAGADEGRALFESLGRWDGLGAEPPAGEAVPDAPPPPGMRFQLVHKAGAPQSVLRIGHLGVSRGHPDWFRLYAMNYALGGNFTSRLNLNLREDKGYTYGINSSFGAARTQGTFCVTTAVESRVTGAAVTEVLLELERIHEGIDAVETEFVRNALTRSLRGSFESGTARLALAEAVGKYGWPDDYPARRLAWLERMTAEELSELALTYLYPDRLTVVVAGDADLVGPQLEALGMTAEVGA